MISHKEIERRRSPRAQFPFELWYKDPNKSGQGFKHAYGKNISEHGIFFETYENFPALTILELKLELPVSETEKKSFGLLAEVVRTEEVKRQWLYNIGVSFCKIDEEWRQLIRNYISDYSNKESRNTSDLLAI